MTPYRFHLKAEQELTQAAAFYDRQEPGLGREFLDAFERSLNLLLEHPEHSLEWLPGVRKENIHRFPYAVFFSPYIW